MRCTTRERCKRERKGERKRERERERGGGAKLNSISSDTRTIRARENERRLPSSLQYDWGHRKDTDKALYWTSGREVHEFCICEKRPVYAFVLSFDLSVMCIEHDQKKCTTFFSIRLSRPSIFSIPHSPEEKILRIWYLRFPSPHCSLLYHHHPSTTIEDVSCFISSFLLRSPFWLCGFFALRSNANKWLRERPIRCCYGSPTSALSERCEHTEGMSCCDAFRRLCRS